MSVKVTDNTAQIVRDMTINANVFLRNMADEIVDIADPVTPKKTGDLRRTVLRQVLGTNGKVVWTRGYAAIQETKQFRRYTTPGTGPHYAEGAVKKAIDKTEQVAKKSRLV
jgi:hypothetical protein